MRLLQQISLLFILPIRLAVVRASLALVTTLIAVSSLSLASPTNNTIAKQALIIDHETDTILLEKNADELMYPSSMSKLMTIYVLFEKLRDGHLSLNDTFFVSERAWRMGGSKMFVAAGSRVTVLDLLRGAIVQSGNDACTVIAENLSESEEVFAQAMTEKAHQMGLQRSHFRNASGWPEAGHVMSARDLATLASRIITDFPEFYSLFRETDFMYNGIRQGNRNPLLYKIELNADGLKTGHTEEGGYGLVASATRNDRRLVMVLNGFDTARQRAQESERLIEWAFREFTNITLFQADTAVSNADVWAGTSVSVPLVTKKKVVITVPRRVSKDVKLATIYNSPILAPVSKASQIATLVISLPEGEKQEVPLVAGNDVEQLGFFGRLISVVKQTLVGHYY